MKIPITREALVRGEACEAARAAFTQIFGCGPVEVTRENLEKVVRDYRLASSAVWTAQHFLSAEQYRRFAAMPTPAHGYVADDCHGCRGEWENFLKVYNEESVDVQKVPG